MSLSRKLESDLLVRQCEEEIRGLHSVFVTWFRGKENLQVLKKDLQSRMMPSFSHVAPNGHMVVGRDLLIQYLTEKYGCYNNRVFSIDVYNVQLLWSSNTHCLASYEEWQSWDDDEQGEQQQFGRLSTCLLENKNATLRWIHVHETWMEAEEPTVKPRDAVSSIDEETVMTGPVPPEDMIKRRVIGSVLPPDNSDDSSEDLLLPPPTRRILLLIHSLSLSDQQTNNQNAAQKIIKETKLGFDVVDAANPGNHDINELLKISGATKYPQFFVKTTDIKFWGTWDDVERSDENGSLEKDLRLPQAPAKVDQEELKQVEKAEEDFMTSEEKQFLEASQGILVFEDEQDTSTPPAPAAVAARKKDLDSFLETEEETIQEPSESNDQASQAMLSVLSASGLSHKRHISPKLEKYAKPLMFENSLVGVSIAGFILGTSQGTMADSPWMADMGSRLEKMAGKRKINLPEMVFPAAHVALEGHGIWMSWDATDCLTPWAQCHQNIGVGSSTDSYRGVSVLKSKDADKWATRRKHGTSDGTFHYDWTFSTPFAVKMEGGDWMELDESGMRMDLLKDKSVPILFFDEIILYEDDLHDNGHVQYSIKLRIMPTCAYILARLWVRVDQVMVRMRETRVLVDFFGIQPQIYRDVSWRECAWKDLPVYGLPNDVKLWRTEQGETPEWNHLVQNIPEVDLPEGLLAHAVLEYGAAAPSEDDEPATTTSTHAAMVEV